MKKVLNHPEKAVEEMIEGLAVLSPSAMRLPGHKVTIRADSEKVRELNYPLEDISATVTALGHTLRQELGGSSGPYTESSFLRCGNVLEQKGAAGLATVDRSSRRG